MKKIDVPTYRECFEKLELLNRPDLRVAQAYRLGGDLNPLERLIYNNEPANPAQSTYFLTQVEVLVDWCINNPEAVLAAHEKLPKVSNPQLSV